MAMAASVNRREKLRAWRQETGRTPMKRLSYVVECAPHPNTSTCTPLQKSKHTKHSLSTFKAPPSSSKRISTQKKKENVSPRGRSGVKWSCGRSVTKPPREGMTKMELGKIRRQMLEEWQALNRRTLKRPPHFLKSAVPNKQKECTQMKKLRQRRHTIGGGGEEVQCRGRMDRAERGALKELFQREIAQEYAGEEGGEGDNGESFVRELKFQDVFNGSREEKEEEEDTTASRCNLRSPITTCKLDYQDKEHTFKSTKVRFMLSEPRKRRSCVPYIHTPRTVYVTPVRRSTRAGRNQDAPGMKLDEERCFDSPSEVSKHLDFDDLHIISNDVLQSK